MVNGQYARLMLVRRRVLLGLLLLARGGARNGHQRAEHVAHVWRVRGVSQVRRRGAGSRWRAGTTGINHTIAAPEEPRSRT